MSKDRKSVAIGRTNTAILAGELDLSAWDDEELLRGQRRNKNGKWTGRPPKVVPKAIHDEWVRRKYDEAHLLLRDNLVGATNVLVELATNENTDDAVRLKAAGMILDRVLGKAPEKVQLDVQVPAFIQAITDGIVSLDSGEDDAIDAPSWEADYDSESDE